MKHEMLGERRKSRFVHDIGRLIEEDTMRLEREGKLKFEDETPAEEANPSIAPVSGYALMDKTNTYALGVHALREACKGDSNCVHPTFVMKDGSSIYRPLTFEENVRARLEDYNTLNNPDGGERSDKDRLRLFNTWLSSCTGIAYKKGSTLFKTIAQSEGLIGIPENFIGYSIPANYSRLQGADFDSHKIIFTKNHIYGEFLTEKQVLKHHAWNAVVTDQSLLKDYAELVFRLNDGNNMGFWVRKNTENDELRALYVGSINYDSGAVGDGLGSGGRFVRATHAAP